MDVWSAPAPAVRHAPTRRYSRAHRLLASCAGRLRDRARCRASPRRVVGVGGAAADDGRPRVADSSGRRPRRGRRSTLGRHGERADAADEAERVDRRGHATRSTRRGHGRRRDEATDESTDEAPKARGGADGRRRRPPPLDPEACARCRPTTASTSPSVAHLTKGDPEPRRARLGRGRTPTAARLRPRRRPSPPTRPPMRPTESDEVRRRRGRSAQERPRRMKKAHIGQDEPVGQEPRQGQEQALTFSTDASR